MNAETFVRSFVTEARALTANSKNRTIWTKAMTDVLRKIGKDQGYHVRCHSDRKRPWQASGVEGEYIKHGECMTVDVSYWSDRLEHSIYKPGEQRRRFHCHPLVCIEHENACKPFAAKRDFNKVCLFAVPLRVFIGYGQTQQKAKDIGEELTSLYLQAQSRQIVDGQTLIIMSARPRQQTDAWFFWLKNGEEAWHELSGS
jgi:hypothetical protein